MARFLSRFGWLPLVAAGALLFYAGRELPAVGDPDSPASTHVSPRYIEKAEEEAGAPNMVTAVLADYRSYDTLGETVVIFTAGLACLLVLGTFRSEGTEIERRLEFSFGSDVLDATSRVIAPFIVLFAAYVVVHGHTSPGGGFQGGAIFAAAAILVQLVRGKGLRLTASLNTLLAIACCGVLAYATIGYITLVFSGNFLDYEALPLPLHGAHLREVGSLGIEIAVFVGVTAVLILIFESLSRGAED